MVDQWMRYQACDLRISGLIFRKFITLCPSTRCLVEIVSPHPSINWDFLYITCHLGSVHVLQFIREHIS